METLIILHGWGSCAENWNGIKQALEKDGVKVFVPDLPGFGNSSPPKYAWSVSDYVEWLKDFCEKQGLSQVFLLGHSFGGRIAIKFAAKYPDKLKGLILASAAGIKAKKKPILNLTFIATARFVKWLRVKRIPIIRNIWQFLRDLSYRFILRKTDYLKAQGIMKEVFKKVVSEDLTPYLAQIKVRTLILWGKKDKMTPVKDGYLMKQKIPNSQLEIIESVGHSLRRQAPQFLIQNIQEFITNRGQTTVKSTGVGTL